MEMSFPLNYVEAGDNGLPRLLTSGQVLSKARFQPSPHLKFTGQYSCQGRGRLSYPFFNNYRPQFYSPVPPDVPVSSLPPEGTEMCMPGDNVDYEGGS